MATPVEWLNEFQVNTGTADTPGISDPQIIGLSNGNFLVAWTENGTTGVATQAGTDIVGKIFNAEGDLVRDSFRINSGLNADDERDFDIAATNDGGWIMVFVDDDISNSSQEAIIWQRFDDGGAQIEGTTTIASNTIAADVLSNPTIVVNNANNTSYVTFTDNVGAAQDDVRAVRVAANGDILTAEFNAAQNSSDFDRNADTAINSNGELVSIYEENDGGTTSIELRVYNTAGTLQHQTTVAAGPGSDPHVATLTNGGIVATWTEGDNVKYRVFDANLVPDAVGGGPFNTDSSPDVHNESHVVGLPDGRFVIVWDNDTDNTLEARVFNANGSVSAPTGNVFVLEPTAGAEINPNVSVTGDGRILFTWEEGDNVFSSIWDTRDGPIDSIDYTGINPPLNFINADDVLTTKIQGGIFNGDGGGETIFGQAGNDTIFGDGGLDIIFGGGGNDIIEGGFFTDEIDGGTGNDTFIIRNGENSDNIVGGTGTDTLDLSNRTSGSGANVDLRNDTYTLQGAANTIESVEIVQGTQLNDTLRGNSGSTLFGNGGNDTFDFRSGDGFPNFNGGGGTDTADFSTFGGTGFFIDLTAGGYRFGATTPGAFSGDLISVENYNGGSGSDVVLGSFSNNVINGNNGNDNLSGLNGNDTLNGGNNDDTLQGGAGLDTVNGDAGNDTIIILNGEQIDFVDGGTGEDILDLSDITTAFGAVNIDMETGVFQGPGVDTTIAGIEEVIGTQQNDVIRGEGGKEILRGQDGDDLLEGRGLADTLDGGNGIDTASYLSSSLGVVVDLVNQNLNSNDAQDDILISIENIQGSGFVDSLRGDGGVNSINAGNGNDVIFARGGNDSLFGGNDNDTLLGGSGGDLINGGNGIDTVSYNETGTAVKADLANAAVNTGIAAGDTYVSIENLTGTNQNDDLRGDNNNNTVTGLGGNDFMIARGGNDTLIGASGNDTMLGGTGADFHNGGSGIDTAAYTDAGAGVLADLEFSVNNTGIAAGDTYLNVENLTGSNFNDNLRGDGGNNRIDGRNGNDIMSGRDGDDTIVGGNGDDIMSGGLGADTMFGGSGTDRARYNDANVGQTADLQVSAFNVGAYAVGDTYSQIEDLQGSNFGDGLRGNGFDNTLFGQDGNDFLIGRNGDDDLRGGNGNDVMTGGNGADIMNGGAGIDQASYIEAVSGVTADLQNSAANTGVAAGDTYIDVENLRGAQQTDSLRGDGGANKIEGFGGDDFILGRGGNDELRGGIGNDTLVGGQGNDLLVGSTGNDKYRFDGPSDGIDTIQDMFSGVDTILLNDSGFTSLTPGALAANNFRAGANAVDADDFVIYNSANGRLYYDEDGAGGVAQVHFATITNTPTLDQDDFLVI